MKLRLDKYLSDMGCGTRSQVRRDISKGLVSVNGVPAGKADLKIDAGTDLVTVNNVPVVYEKYEYYMLNKPAGVVSATEDRRDRTVLDLIREKRRDDLFPVGRLDKDTEGFLLITNDGALAHRLLSPKKHVDKVYFARVQGEVTEADAELFSRGVDIGDDRPTLPAVLEIVNSGTYSEVLLTIREGRFHQVKRMFHAVGKEVVYLKRLQMGPLKLDETLAPGEYRRLKKEEVDTLC